MLADILAELSKIIQSFPVRDNSLQYLMNLNKM